MRTKIVIMTGITLTLLGAFQNCSSGKLPETSTATSVAAAAPASLVLGTMAVLPATQTVAAGGSATFTIDRGNVTSVSYVCMTSANATVANGTLSQGQTSLTVPVSAAFTCAFQGDGTNLVQPANVNVSVALPAAAPVVVSCTDIVYADPQGPAMGYAQNSNVTFVSNIQSALNQIPAGCTFTTASVSFGRFGSNGFSCAQTGAYDNLSAANPYLANDYIRGAGSGNKFANGSAQLSGNVLTLTESTAGWGDAGGTSTQACISNVRVTLHTRAI